MESSVAWMNNYVRREARYNSSRWGASKYDGSASRSEGSGMMRGRARDPHRVVTEESEVTGCNFRGSIVQCAS